MNVKEMAAEFLACPECKGNLAYKASNDREILICGNCGVYYEVEDGIPVLLIEEAKKIGETDLNLNEFHD